jgi:hypothetical protein
MALFAAGACREFAIFLTSPVINQQQIGATNKSCDAEAQQFFR